MNCSIISAVNNEEVLNSCLLKSPALGANTEVILQRGFSSAADAYNAGLQQAAHDVVVFAHQDVYFPEGWLESLETTLDYLAKTDPDWGVLGIWGVTPDGGRAGYLYWTGLKGIAGSPFEGAMEVATLDEVVLIVRKSSGLKFDREIPGWHMYGADICLQAQQQGMKCYAISTFCIHNCNEYKMLPVQFWECYLKMRRKWKQVLPIETTCAVITRFCWPMVRWNLVRFSQLALGKDKPNTRAGDGREVYQRLIASGLVTAPAAGRRG